MHPDWFGGPQHLVAGAVLAAATVWWLRRWVHQPWLLAVVALGTTAVAEIGVELVEYPLLYADEFHASAYYDTFEQRAAAEHEALRVAVTNTRSSLFAKACPCTSHNLK